LPSPQAPRPSSAAMTTLLVLHPWRGVRILNPADYLALV
jgi:hypothetical protein